MATDLDKRARLRAQIVDTFSDVFREQNEGAMPPEMADETLLAKSGLDSLGFAILVTILEESLGYDPFTLSPDPYYPLTFGEFVDVYYGAMPK